MNSIAHSNRYNAVNQMPSLVEDSLCHTDVLKEQQRFWKRILIVDDDNDITTTFKAAIEDSNNGNDVNRRIEVYTSNNPMTALSEFKPNFYDLVLADINMPHMNGFELCEKILVIDINMRICFMSSLEINREGLARTDKDASGCEIEPSMFSTMHRLRTWDFRTQVRTSTDQNLRIAFNELR